MKTKQSMTLRTFAMVAALWLACAASALAQTNIYNGTRNGGEQPSTGENNGGNTGTDQPVDPGTGGDTPVSPTTNTIATSSALIDACNSNSIASGTVFQLTANITLPSEIRVKNSVTLDLNSYSIASQGKKCLDIQDNVTLTIVDSSTGGQKGSINCAKDSPPIAIEINSNANLIADGVTITSTHGIAISNGGGTAEITGCTVSGSRGIYNKGTMTVTGGSISGTHTAIQNDGGTISINTGENPAACSISAGNWGIYNQMSGNVTLGSGVSIANCTKSGIFNVLGTFTLNAWPTFSPANSSGFPDIWLSQDQKITIGSTITAAPTKKISVRLTDLFENDLTAADLPETFTSGYASHVIDGSSNVIDPAEVFTYYKSDAAFAVALTGEGSSAEAQLVTAANAPVGTDVTDALSPTVDANDELTWEFEMPDYDVLVTVVYEDDPNVVTFAFAEGQEWMTWCSEASFTKPDGIDAYTIADATPDAITVTPITASDASQPAVLPAYTPLLLRKNGYEGLTAKQYAVPTAPTDDLFKDYGIVSHATTDCTLYGSTKAVTDAASSQVFALGRTYMLKSGEFVTVDQFDGIAANRCWLTLSGTPAASRLQIRRGGTTEVSGVKELRPVRDDAWYSITGRRVSKPTRGVYINNGRKILIK